MRAAPPRRWTLVLSALLLLAVGLSWSKHRSPAQLPIARDAAAAPRADVLERQRALVRSVIDHAAHFLPGEAPPPHLVEHLSEYSRFDYAGSYGPEPPEVVSPEISFLGAVYDAAAEQGLTVEDARATLAAFVMRVRRGAPGALLDPALACFAEQDFAGAERLALAVAAQGERTGAKGAPFLQVIADPGHGLRQSILQLREAWLLAGDAQVLQSKYWEAKTSFAAAARLVARSDFAHWLEVEWRLGQVASFDARRIASSPWPEIARRCAVQRGAENRQTLRARSWVDWDIRRYDEISHPGHDPALASHSDVLATRERVFGPDDLDVARSLTSSEIRPRRGSGALPLAAALEALTIRERRLPPDHPETLRNLRQIASMYGHLEDDYFLAARMGRRALAMSERLFGPKHLETARDAEELAGYLSKTRPAEAETLLRRVVAMREQQLGWDAPAVLQALASLDRGREDAGQPTELRRYLDQHLAAAEKEHGPEHVETMRARLALLSHLAERADRSDADRDALLLLARATLSASDRLLGEAPEDVPNLRDRLLLARAQRESLTVIGDLALPEVVQAEHLAYRLQEASARVLQTQVALAESQLGRGHPDVAEHLENYAEFLLQWKKPAERERVQRRVFEIHLLAHGPGDWRVQSSLRQLSATQEAAGRFDEVEALARWMLEYQQKWPEDQPVEEAERLTDLAEILQKVGKVAEVEPLLRRALAKWDQAQDRSAVHNELAAIEQLADLLRLQDRGADAVVLYRQTLKLIEKNDMGSSSSKSNIISKLGELLGDLGQFTEAAAWFKEADAIDRNKVTDGRKGVLLAQQGMFAEARTLLAPAILKLIEERADEERRAHSVAAAPSPTPELTELRQQEAASEPLARFSKYLALADASLAPSPAKEAAPTPVKRK